MACRTLTHRLSGLLRQPLQKNVQLFTRCHSCAGITRIEKRLHFSLRLYPQQQKQVLRCFSSDVQITDTDEPDILYRGIDIYLKGHEDSVLDSFSNFATIAADELGIKVAGVLKPRMITNRLTLLKSIHIHKKHRVQYEAHTHKMVIQLQHLTGSTANAYLSYLQINIPAGVAMHVHKWAIESLPEHIEKAMEKKHDQITEEDEKVADKFRAKMADSKLTINEDYEEYKTSKPYLIGTTM